MFTLGQFLRKNLLIIIAFVIALGGFAYFNYNEQLGAILITDPSNSEPGPDCTATGCFYVDRTPALPTDNILAGEQGNFILRVRDIDLNEDGTPDGDGITFENQGDEQFTRGYAFVRMTCSYVDDSSNCYENLPIDPDSSVTDYADGIFDFDNLFNVGSQSAYFSKFVFEGQAYDSLSPEEILFSINFRANDTLEQSRELNFTLTELCLESSYRNIYYYSEVGSQIPSECDTSVEPS